MYKLYELKMQENQKECCKKDNTHQAIHDNINSGAVKVGPGGKIIVNGIEIDSRKD